MNSKLKETITGTAQTQIILIMIQNKAHVTNQCPRVLLGRFQRVCYYIFRLPYFRPYLVYVIFIAQPAVTPKSIITFVPVSENSIIGLPAVRRNSGLHARYIEKGY